MKPQRYIIGCCSGALVCLGLLLLSGFFSPAAWAGRYVLNQTPQTIQQYFGRPLSQVPPGQTRSNETAYFYTMGRLRRLIPTLPQQATFAIGFINNRAQSIWLDVNAPGPQSFTFGRAEAFKLYEYVFGYRPSIWKQIPLPFGGGGHEGFRDNKFCLGDGVGTTFMSYQLGEEGIRLYYDSACEPPY